MYACQCVWVHARAFLRRMHVGSRVGSGLLAGRNRWSLAYKYSHKQAFAHINTHTSFCGPYSYNHNLTPDVESINLFKTHTLHA